VTSMIRDMMFQSLLLLLSFSSLLLLLFVKEDAGEREFMCIRFMLVFMFMFLFIL
jgi:hypothetical protein